MFNTKHNNLHHVYLFIYSFLTAASVFGGISGRLDRHWVYIWLLILPQFKVSLWPLHCKDRDVDYVRVFGEIVNRTLIVGWSAFRVPWCYVTVLPPKIHMKRKKRLGNYKRTFLLWISFECVKWCNKSSCIWAQLIADWCETVCASVLSHFTLCGRRFTTHFMPFTFM